MLASLRPARRATRVPPIAAVREGAKLPPGRFAKYRGVGSATLASWASSRSPTGCGERAERGRFSLFMGIGAVLDLLRGRAVHVAADQAARGRRSAFPGDRLAGAPGILARENAIRNPQRTGSSAAALMIGLTLVTLVTLLATSIRASFFGARRQDLRRRLRGHRPEQLRPDPGGDRADAPADAGRERRRSASGSATCAVFGDRSTLSAVDPGGEQDLPARLDRRLAGGARHARRRTAPSRTRTTPKKHDLDARLARCRSLVPNGETADLRIKGIFDPPPGGSPFGPRRRSRPLPSTSSSRRRRTSSSSSTPTAACRTRTAPSWTRR